MSIKLVVFDMAGTTVADDNDVAKVLRQAIAAFGCDVTIDDVNTVMGLPKPVAIQQLLEACGKPFNNALIADIHELFAEKMMAHYRAYPGIAEKAGVRETFRQLKARNIKVGIDTGFSRCIADVVIERLRWRDDNIYDVSITSDEVPQGRPYPDMIYKAMQLTGISDVQEVAKVGDTASDLRQGNAAGCKYVIGVTTGAYSRDELLLEPHTHLIDQLDELLQIVA